MAQMTRQEALKMLAMAFQEPESAVREGVSRENLGGWDSMGALALMAELDERFGLLLTAETSRAMTRVDDILEFLRKNGVLLD